MSETTAPARLGDYETLDTILGPLRSHEVPADTFVRNAIEAIERVDPWLQAWVCSNLASVADARCADLTLPLGGVPFGVKDIIDVRGLPTRYGVDILPANPAAFDAWCVAALRSAGAIPIGKTHTVPFANSPQPTPTLNPWNPLRAPGGSSTGSAAAVAAGIVPFALGTQTTGSVLRPACYNGVVGFKPTFGRVPTTGVSPLAPSADQIGIFARSVGDASLVFRCIDPSCGAAQTPRRIRLLCDPDFHAAVTNEDQRALLRAVMERLRSAGMQVATAALPPELEPIGDAHVTILSFEGHATVWPVVRGTPAERLVFSAGESPSRSAYEEAFRVLARHRPVAERLFEQCDAVLTLTAGPAPARDRTGSTANHLIRPWTALGFPSITIPCGLDGDGMPVGLQLAARRDADAELLAVAAAIEAVVGFDARPDPNIA